MWELIERCPKDTWKMLERNLMHERCLKESWKMLERWLKKCLKDAWKMLERCLRHKCKKLKDTWNMLKRFIPHHPVVDEISEFRRRIWSRRCTVDIQQVSHPVPLSLLWHWRQHGWTGRGQNNCQVTCGQLGLESGSFTAHLHNTDLIQMSIFLQSYSCFSFHLLPPPLNTR